MVKDWFPLAIVLYTKPYMREISWSREWWSAFRISADDPNLNHPAFSMLHVPSILADNPTHFFCTMYNIMITVVSEDFPQSAKRCACLVMWAYQCMYTVVCGLHTSQDIWELIQPFFFFAISCTLITCQMKQRNTYQPSARLCHGARTQFSR